MSIGRLSLTPNRHHRVLISVDGNSRISVAYNRTTDVISHVHNFFRPSDVLISALILALHPANLLPLIASDLPVHLLPARVVTNSPVHDHSVDLNSSPNVGKRL